MYHQSWAVLEFADFMTRSWTDTRLEKVVSLCIHYHGKPALVAASLVALAMFTLTVLRKLPTL
eukprot:UN5163